MSPARALSATDLIDLVRRLGGMLRAHGDRLRVTWVGSLPPGLVEELREQKAALLPLLDGSRCRCCGEGPLDWRTPGLAVALGDGSSMHGSCWRAHVAVDPKHAADPGEVGLHGKALP